MHFKTLLGLFWLIGSGAFTPSLLHASESLACVEDVPQRLPLRISDTLVEWNEWDAFPISYHESLNANKEIWGSFELFNCKNNAQSVVLNFGWLDEATITIYKVNTVISGKLGHFVRKNDRIPPANSSFLPSPSVLNIELSAHEKVLITFHSKKITPFINIMPEVSTLKHWQTSRSEFISTRNLWQGVFFGFLMVVFFYNLFTYIHTKEKPHLFYALYALSLFLSLLPPLELVYETFLEPYPYLIRHIELTGDYGFVLFYLLFMRSFLNLKAKHPLLDKIIIINSWGLIVLWGVSQLWFLITGIHYPTQWGYQASAIISIMVFLFVYAKLLFVKDILVRYIIVGSLAALIGALIVLCNLLFSENFPVNAYYIMQAGHMAELLIFLLGLSIRSKIQLEDAFKASELSKYQNRFFTNISHELRTPLTLIKAPISKLLGSEVDEKQKEELLYIQSNANRLELLINQILEVTALENNKKPLKVAYDNIIQVLTPLFHSFEYIAQQRKIHLQMINYTSTGNLYFNEEAVTTIFNNLLINAVKFCNDEGIVRLHITEDKNWLHMAVFNTGKPISKLQIEQIFNRFYYDQENSSDLQISSGIGLNLVSELVKWHKGKIEVVSDANKGTTFTVLLSMDSKTYSNEEIQLLPKKTKIPNKNLFTEPGLVESKNINLKEPAQKTVMIVEDNHQLANYLLSLLREQYHTLLAYDGAQALDILDKTSVDIIISDIMMPHINGISLCEEIKTNILTSHIPFIILTAKADHESKIQGLKVKADDYIVKPFDNEELLLKVHNLLDHSEKIANILSEKNTIKPDDIDVSSVDKVFLQQVIDIVTENIPNESFTVEDLAAEIGLSRSQLHRKLNGLIRQSPNYIIRNMRLERARGLLQKNAGTVSEIAFMTGFNTVNYFSKCFKDAYGYAPSEVKRISH